MDAYASAARAKVQDEVLRTYKDWGLCCGTGILFAVCVSPLVIVLCLYGVIANEHDAVCMDRVFASGEDLVKEIPCEDVLQGEGDLVMVGCKLRNTKEDLQPLFASGVFKSSSVRATGLSTVTEMLQCVEKQRTSFARGWSKYEYRISWEKHPVDSGSFRGKTWYNFLSGSEFHHTCGMENPSWDADIPATKNIYASNIGFGSFSTDDEDLIKSIPLNTPVMSFTVPAGWVEQEGGVFEKANTTNPHGIGSVRTRFFVNNWTDSDVTVLGMNDGGNIRKWTGPSSWLCSGFQVASLQMGTFSREQMFHELMHKEAEEVMASRIGFFWILWFGFCCCLRPTRLSDDNLISEAVACGISCVPSTVCFIFLVGVMWLVMRPLESIGLFIAVVALTVLAYFVWSKYLQGAGQGSPAE